MRSQLRRMVVALPTTFVLGCASAPHAAPVPAVDGLAVLPYDTLADAAARGAGPSTVLASVPTQAPTVSRIGLNDELQITVFEAPELNRTVRVAETGMISLPLLGEVRAAGQTPRELELALQASLGARYIRDPHVSVQLSEMQSRAVSVVGAVARPGVFQLREPRSLLELIALAGGLAPDAGESVIVVRGDAPPAAEAANGAPGGEPDGASAPAAAATSAAVTISLRALLESGDPRHNIMIEPGDLVKVTPAGLVYVVGDVRRPGAFPLARRPGLTVLQAIALGEGFGPNASKGRTMIIRTGPGGERVELRVDVGDVIAGRVADTALQPQDVVFVPSNTARAVTIGMVEALVRMVTLRGVF